MAAFGDHWEREYKEAVKLADDITTMNSERSSNSASGQDAQRYSSSIRRKISILGTRLDGLESIPKRVLGKHLSDKEINLRKEMVSDLRSKVNEMTTTLNMSNFASRENLLGSETKTVDAMTRTTGLDNNGIIGLQRQVMKEQDEGLEKLEKTIVSTKHIALAVNEELELQVGLIDKVGEHVEVTDSRLLRVQKKLAILNKRTKAGSSCCCLLLSVTGIAVLVAIIYFLVKYL